jgi:class 3 adenylate cyclase
MVSSSKFSGWQRLSLTGGDAHVDLRSCGGKMAISSTLATVAAERRARARISDQFGRQTEAHGSSPRVTCAPNTCADDADDQLLPTGTVTLLLADIEGSTRIWESEPDRMAAALATMDRVLADVVRTTNGVCPVAQGEGDSFVVAFTRASDGVACALALQRAALSPIRLRIGVHTGQVLMRDRGNYMGPTINRTARLRELAHGGQIVLSGATSDLVCTSLPDRAWLTRLGWYTLRDLARPERVAQLCHPDLRNDFPPLRTRPVAR